MLVCILMSTSILLVSHHSQVFQEMWRSPGKTGLQIIQEQDLGLVSDAAQLHDICQNVVDSHPDEVRTHANSHLLLRSVCLHVCDVLCLLCLSVGSRHQEWKRESSEQADGPGSERD